MNHDEFEKKLRVLTAKLTRPDPAAKWKAEILARARQSRQKNTTRFPRALLSFLGLLWLLIAVLRFTTPPDTMESQEWTGAEAFTPQDEMRIRMLIAFHSDRELLDLP